MKVKLNTAVGIKGESHAKGDVISCNKDTAMALILSNKGVEHVETPKAKKKK
tara:strand:+ start:3055 stop:3210 length:156 start_codon:yes stop_codon:yes gene_type:complete